MNYINNNIVNTLTPTELDNLKGTTSNIQTQLNQISPNVGTIAPVNQVIASNDTLNIFANKTQGQINTILANGTGGGGVNSVTLDGIQTLTNKTLTDPKLTNNIIKSSTDKNITIPDVIDTLVSLTAAQTLINKTLTNCTANTQTTTDNSTNIATTEFVKNVVNISTYNGTKYYNGVEIEITTPTEIELISATLPVIGTYEIIYSVYIHSLDTHSYCKGGAYLKYNDGTVIPKSSIICNFYGPGGLAYTNTLTKSIIITTDVNEKIIKLFGSKNPGGSTSNTGTSASDFSGSKIKFPSSSLTGSNTYLSYKLLGYIPTNMSLYALKTDLEVSTRNYNSSGTLPLSLEFDKYIINLTSNTTSYIKTKTGTSNISGYHSSSYKFDETSNFSNKQITTTETSFTVTSNRYFGDDTTTTIKTFFTDSINVFDISIINFNTSSGKYLITVVKLT